MLLDVLFEQILGNGLNLVPIKILELFEDRGASKKKSVLLNFKHIMGQNRVA